MTPELPPKTPARKYARPKPNPIARDYGTKHQHLREQLLALYPVCQDCERAWATEAHHLVYPSRSLADYASLCRACHLRRHQKG